MQFIVDQLTLLGLNAREIRTFTTIATFGQMKTTMVARRANLSRTTVDAIVRRLEKQGIVESVVVTKHTEWRVDLERVSMLLNLLEIKITSNGEKNPEAKLDFDEFFVKKINGDKHTELRDSAAAQHICSVHLTPRGILLSDLSGKQGVYIEHVPLRLKLGETLPSVLWSEKKRIDENEGG